LYYGLSIVGVELRLPEFSEMSIALTSVFAGRRRRSTLHLAVVDLLWYGTQ
jgi:hypothetical protein